MMAQQSFQYTFLLNKHRQILYILIPPPHPEWPEVWVYAIIYLTRKTLWNCYNHAFSSEITLNVVEFREQVVQTATQEDGFRGSILSILWGTVISKIRKRQIQYPKEQIINTGLGVLTEDMERKALLTRFCLLGVWVRQSLRLSLCIMRPAWIQGRLVWTECKNWLGALSSPLQENLCSWKVRTQSCL